MEEYKTLSDWILALQERVEVLERLHEDELREQRAAMEFNKLWLVQ